MLGLIISAAVGVDQQFNKAVPIARNRSAQIVSDLDRNPQEAATLIHRLSNPYASCHSDKVPNWRNKLASMTGSYQFGGNFIYAMRPEMDGILIIAECVITPFWGTGIGSVCSLPSILNVPFFVFEDPVKRTVYVHSYHAQQREHILAARIFGEELLALIPYSEVQAPMPRIAEAPKPWWKKVF